MQIWLAMQQDPLTTFIGMFILLFFGIQIGRLTALNDHYENMKRFSRKD